VATASLTAVRAAIARRALDAVYLILGDDEAEMARLAGDIAGVVEDELRAFNMERLYAGEKGASASGSVGAAPSRRSMWRSRLRDSRSSRKRR
jgi:hypothetical protein